MTGVEHTFYENGYVILRDLVPKSAIDTSLEFLKNKLSRATGLLEKAGIDIDSESAVQDIHDLLHDHTKDQLGRDLKTILTGHYPLNVRLDEALWSIPREKSVLDAISRILQTDHCRMHMPPMARFVIPGNTDAGVPAHQDATYNSHLSNFITMWVPLVDIDEKCGGVRVYPGSDKGEIDTNLMSHGIWYEKIETTNYDGVACLPMKAGDVLFFNRFLIHESLPNISDRMRFSLDYRFFSAKETTTKHCLDMKKWEVLEPND